MSFKNSLKIAVLNLKSQLTLHCSHHLLTSPNAFRSFLNLNKLHKKMNQTKNLTSVKIPRHFIDHHCHFSPISAQKEIKFSFSSKLTYRSHVFPSKDKSRFIDDNVGVKAKIVLRHIQTSMYENVFLDSTWVIWTTWSDDEWNAWKGKNWALITSN